MGQTYIPEVRAGFPCCGSCGSFVPDDNQPVHDGWHAQVDELIKVVRALGRVAPTGPDTGAIASARDFDRVAAFGVEPE